MVLERNREETEKKILEAVGRIIAANGFEKVGVNAVAAESGLSKMLIYRYFDSLDGLLAAYIKRNDYWLNIDLEVPSNKEEVIPFVIGIYQSQVEQLRSNIIMRRLLRWELTAHNDMIVRIREKREERGTELIRIVSGLSGKPENEIAPMASLISASITYLVLLSDCCDIYNGIAINSDKGWETILHSIEEIVNKYIG
ncbi:TetR/AcrR family transcriptional regulator [Parabacteroides sp.]